MILIIGIVIILVIGIILFKVIKENLSINNYSDARLTFHTCMQYYNEPKKCYWYTGGFDKTNPLFKDMSRFPAYSFKI